MTNTEGTIAPAKWVTPRSATNSYGRVYELLRLAAPAAEVAALFTALTRIRGAHFVEIHRNHGDVVGGVYVESPWFSISFRGTDRAARGAANLLMESGLQNLDKNADHERCIAAARKAGVPASWAHRIETYLSM